MVPSAPIRKYSLSLCSAVFLFIQGLSPCWATPQGDGRLRLFNYHLDEYSEVTFRENGKIVAAGIAEINRMFRSRDNSAVIKMQIELIDLLDHLQDHFEADAIEIISGYRTKALNKQLQNEGHAVSPVSFHMAGQAADIHIDEIREETVRDYVEQLKTGGVGYYGPMDFVHVDRGPVRTWGRRGPFPRKLVGFLDKDIATQLTSNKNDYLKGNTLHFQWTQLDPAKLKDIQLEHFFRGKWNRVPMRAPAETRQQRFELPFSAPLFQHAEGRPRYGKYRWSYHLSGVEKDLFSNEFYLKRL